MRTLRIISPLMLLLGCFSLAHSQLLELSFEKPIEVYNNQVGHEWRFGFGVNKTFYPNKESISVPVSSASTLEFIIQELDKYTDQATQSLSIFPHEMEYNKVYTKKLELVITENGGRFKGQTAQFNVLIRYKKVLPKA